MKVVRFNWNQRFNYLLGLLFCGFVIIIITTGNLDSSNSDSKNAESGLSQRSSVELKTGTINNIRILCLVVTCSKYLNSKARAVQQTWAKDCDKTLFISDEANDTFPALKMGPSGRNMLWFRTRQMFILAYKEYLLQFDWFLKADDDTYISMRNLKKMTSRMDPSHAHFLGRQFKGYLEHGYNSGGAGYVINREALTRLGPRLINNSARCRSDSKGAEDIQFAYCLESVGVVPNKTLDEEGRERFHPMSPYEMFFKRIAWLQLRNYYPQKVGPECCSGESISFHHIRPENMTTMYFLKNVFET